jgi:hypothetical protein
VLHGDAIPHTNVEAGVLHAAADTEMLHTDGRASHTDAVFHGDAGPHTTGGTPRTAGAAAQ